MPASASPVSVAEPAATILDLPSEVLQNIAMNLPFPYDALNLSQVSRQLYAMLSPDNKYFWYERRRTYETSRDETQVGIIKKDASEPFDEKSDYRQLVVDARRGQIGGNRLQRCQVCCFQRAHKKWEEWKMWICPGCFEIVAIDRPVFKFLKLDVSGLKCQRKRRNMSIRYCYWRADVDRLVLQQFGKSLNEMIAENEAEKKAKEDAATAYRNRQVELLIKVVEDLLKNDPEYAKYARFFDAHMLSSNVQCQCKYQSQSFNLRKGDHSQKWLVKFAKEKMLPGPLNDDSRSGGRLFNDWKFRGALRTAHYKRFGYIVDPEAVNVGSSDIHKRWINPAATDNIKEPYGVCPYCFANPRKATDEHYTKLFNYMSVGQLVDHVVGCHYTNALSEEFWFLQGVKDREVVRLEKDEPRPAVEIPDGGNMRVMNVERSSSSGGSVVVRNKVGGFIDDLDFDESLPVTLESEGPGEVFGADEELEPDAEDEDLAAEVEDLVRDNLKALASTL